MWTAIWIIGWLPCAVVAYVLIRHEWRRALPWTVGDRRIFGVMALLLGPLTLVAALIMVAVGHLPPGDAPARW